jgi:hypothetical protein
MRRRFVDGVCSELGRLDASFAAASSVGFCRCCFPDRSAMFCGCVDTGKRRVVMELRMKLSFIKRRKWAGSRHGQRQPEGLSPRMSEQGWARGEWSCRAGCDSLDVISQKLNWGLSGICRECFRGCPILESNGVFRGEKYLTPCLLTRTIAASDRTRASLHSDRTEVSNTKLTRSGNNTHHNIIRNHVWRNYDDDTEQLHECCV